MELEHKYNKLVSDLATEKQERNKLMAELDVTKIHLAELEATNSHLIAATWRERDLKKKLSDTVNELNQTKVIVENQNKRITESINYSQNIQRAINPTEADLQSCFEKSFILYLPKDLISGDFPWLFTSGNYTYIASADCTGHGVPGAMMSIIGNLLLKDIIHEGNDLLPSQILAKLHKAVVSTLKQDKEIGNSNDGMDIGLCRINTQTSEVLFSGAHRPLFLLRDGKIQILKGDKFPIGGMHYKGLNKYNDQTIELMLDDRIFMFTDGLTDQMGGELKEKLGSRNLISFFEANCNLNMAELKTRMLHYFKAWKADFKQLDDVLLIGIQF